MVVGFSTGVLYWMKLSSLERAKLLLNLNVEAIELLFAQPDDLFEAKPDKEIIESFNKLKYLTIHAPSTIFYMNNEETHNVLDKLSELCGLLPINGITLHRDLIRDFNVLLKSKLPFLIENMDANSTIGTNPEHFEPLLKYPFDFVLDIQHIYEVDPTMELTKKFLELFGSRLKELHISGSNMETNHCPAYSADNKEAIKKALEMSINVPKILEGAASLGDLKKELEYIRSLEC